jgi:hypothetical protein
MGQCVVTQNLGMVKRPDLDLVSACGGGFGKQTRGNELRLTRRNDVHVANHNL